MVHFLVVKMEGATGRLGFGPELPGVPRRQTHVQVLESYRFLLGGCVSGEYLIDVVK